MRTVGVPILLAISIFGCSEQQGTPEATDAQTAFHSNERESLQRINAPRLWTDEDAASMIKVVSGLSDSGDRVYVARWENGAVRGQVKLESSGDSKPLSFDLSIPSDLSDATSIDVVSGWVVVTMRRLINTDGEAYDVRIEQQFTIGNDTDSTTLGLGSRSGTLMRVPPDTDPNNFKARAFENYSKDRRWELLKSQDQRSVPWLELNLVSTPLEAYRVNAEQSDEREPE